MDVGGAGVGACGACEGRRGVGGVVAGAEGRAEVGELVDAEGEEVCAAGFAGRIGGGFGEVGAGAVAVEDLDLEEFC